MSVNGFPPLIINDQLIATTVRGVESAFSNLFGSEVTPGKHTVHDAFVSKGDISGILGMIQDKVEATLVISFEKGTIFNVLEKLYGHPFQDINDSVKQGVGELTNIIYAGMKKELNEKGHKFKMSIPSVVIGSNHAVYSLHRGETLVIPFVSTDGAFFVEIALQTG